MFDLRFLTIAVSAIFFGLPPVQASSHQIDDEKIQDFFDLKSPRLDHAQDAFGEKGKVFRFYTECQYTEAKYVEKEHHLRVARMLEGDDVTVSSVFLVYDALRTNFDVVNYAIENARTLGLSMKDHMELRAIKKAQKYGTGVKGGDASASASASASAASASGKADAEDTEVVRTPIARGVFLDAPPIPDDPEFARYERNRRADLARSRILDIAKGVYSLRDPGKTYVPDKVFRHELSGARLNCCFNLFGCVNPLLRGVDAEHDARERFIKYLTGNLKDPIVREYFEIASRDDEQVTGKASAEEYLEAYLDEDFMPLGQGNCFFTTDGEIVHAESSGFPAALAYLSGVNLKVYTFRADQGSQLYIDYKHPDDVDGNFPTVKGILYSGHFSALNTGDDDEYAQKIEEHGRYQIYLNYLVAKRVGHVFL